MQSDTTVARPTPADSGRATGEEIAAMRMTDGAPAVPSEDQPQKVEDAERLQPYKDAAKTIGIGLQSRECTSATFQRTGDARNDFETDHLHFMCEHNFKVKVCHIGGSELNVYGLYKAVLDHGGLQSVIYHRAFTKIARTLSLPKTCTSASFVLRNVYDILLYAYEEMHVWGRQPGNLRPIVEVGRRMNRATRPVKEPPQQVRAPPEPVATCNLLPNPNTRPPQGPPCQPASIENCTANCISPSAHTQIPHRSRLTGLKETLLETQKEPHVEKETFKDAVPQKRPNRPFNPNPRQVIPPAVSEKPATNGIADDAYTNPYFPGGSELIRLDETIPDIREEQPVGNEVKAEVMAHGPYVPEQQTERGGVVAALQRNFHCDESLTTDVLKDLFHDVMYWFLVSESRPSIKNYITQHVRSENVLLKPKFRGIVGWNEIKKRYEHMA